MLSPCTLEPANAPSTRLPPATFCMNMGTSTGGFQTWVHACFGLNHLRSLQWLTGKNDNKSKDKPIIDTGAYLGKCVDPRQVYTAKNII